MTGAVRIRCPATSANLGPGFDALGVALDRYNQFEVALADGFAVEASGPGADRIREDPADNLVVRSYQAARAELGLPPAEGLRVRIQVGVPPSRGLGSSATAAVAGVLAANALHGGGDGLSRQRLLALAVACEGHPDNVVPCLLGGLCVAASGRTGAPVALRSELEDPPGLVIAVPRELELSTQAMRARLPASVPFAHATANVGRAALLLLALQQGDRAALAAALEDRLHEPYRTPLIPGYGQAVDAALRAGALGVVVSGSGPTLLAFTPRQDQRRAVAEAMASAWAEAGVPTDAEPVGIEPVGARVER